MIPVAHLLLNQARIWLPNTRATRRLSAFQSSDVRSLTVHLGSTFGIPEKSRFLPPSNPVKVVHNPTFTTNDLATIRKWKTAMANSFRISHSLKGDEVVESSDPKVDYVRYTLRNGKSISYRLSGPWDVKDRWGETVESLFRDARDQILRREEARSMLR